VFDISLEGDWIAIPQTEGIWGRLLSGDFDETAASGHRTRLIRFEAGGRTREPYVHAYWEEVYIIEGDLQTSDGIFNKGPAYVIRPPGTQHGPFVSPSGCLMLEVQYFSSRQIGLRDFLDAKATSGAP
jgi:hypothetical protein